jgi:hypothetical protein
MDRAHIALVTLLLMCSACTAANQSVAKNDSRWLMLTSPGTPDYPWGRINMPIAQWQPLMTYPSEDTCDRSLGEAQNAVQNPVTCVAANDAQLDHGSRSMGQIFALTSHD